MDYNPYESHSDAMRVLIVGCGYVGLPLGIELKSQGHEVHGLRRNGESANELADKGIQLLIADITKKEELIKWAANYDWVVNCVSSTQGGAEEYRQVYLQGTRNLIEWLAGSSLKKFVYTSSTSVYGQTDGSAVKETSPTEPKNETSQILAQTETVLMDAALKEKFPAVILRVAGIYGPERGHLFRQYLRNEARIAGHGERLINMIHRDDVVGAIIAALKSGRPGEIYNAVDDEPVAQINFFRWLSETLGKNMPPFATGEENAERKRGLTQKKVSNRKLTMELGYRLKYSNFRKGYTAEIQRLDEAGLLDIKPEPR